MFTQADCDRVNGTTAQDREATRFGQESDKDPHAIQVALARTPTIHVLRSQVETIARHLKSLRDSLATGTDSEHYPRSTQATIEWLDDIHARVERLYADESAA